MNTYRVELCLRSALGTPLSADTLFGHLCWGLVCHEGAQRLAAFLTEMDGPEPPLVISDPLPKGHWPMPVLPGPPPEACDRLLHLLGGGHEVDAHDRVKRVLRRPYVSASGWTQLAGQLDSAALAERLLQDDADEVVDLRRVTVPHNAINRLTTHTGGEEGVGGLFFDEQLFPASRDGRAFYDVWVRSTWPAERVKEVFVRGLEFGYGRDAATGKGHLTVEVVEPAELPVVPRPNAVVTLGVCVPAAGDPADGTWNVEVRRGKLGGAWAVGADEDAVFKHPVVMLSRGAVLRTDEPRPVLGRMVHGVHPHRPEVVTCGYTLTLPVRLTEEAIPCPAFE